MIINTLENIARKLLAEARYYRFLTRDKTFVQRHKHLPRKARKAIKGNAQLVSLAERCGISFKYDAKNGLFADIPLHGVHIKFILNKKEHFFLLMEQFVNRGSYNFILDRPVVVMDIGMSVGDTALFFAANPFVEKVYSYELMPQIYKRALRNLKFNPELMNKIEHYNYGLGKQDQEMKVPYYDTNDVCNGLFNDGQQEMLGESYLTSCSVKNALSELQKIVEEHPDTELYLKIDAEGVEYEIIDMIFQSPLKRNIYYISMEYHFGIQNLVDVLKANHFEVIENFIKFDVNRQGSQLGMIKAIRQHTK